MGDDATGSRTGAAVRRVDYFDDPGAPAANSLVPSANVVVTDGAGRVLVIHWTDNDDWAVPGGAMDRAMLFCLQHWLDGRPTPYPG